MYLGLAWHVIINMALDGTATSPGWYVHILMPLGAPIVGIAYSEILKSGFRSKLFMSFLIYSILFQIVAIFLHASLFGAAAVKGATKIFSLSSDTLSIDTINRIYSNLSIISFPNLSFVLFFLGFSLLICLVIISRLK
jgi:hypothetical protein